MPISVRIWVDAQKVLQSPATYGDCAEEFPGRVAQPVRQLMGGVEHTQFCLNMASKRVHRWPDLFRPVSHPSIHTNADRVEAQTTIG